MLYVDDEKYPRKFGEPEAFYDIRSVRATRLDKLKEVRQELGEIGIEDQTYRAIQALTEIVEDIIERNFV